MILLLGGSGYIGQAFARALERRGADLRALSRRDADYTRFGVLLELLRRDRPEFLINAAGFTGKPNVDACEQAKADTLAGNTLLPQTIAQACAVTGTPWGHVSSGCIYSGAKVVENGRTRVEKDLTRPELQALVRERREVIRGFTETDPPNFSFRDPPCSFYSGTKALGEEALDGAGACYIWRLRIPFDEWDNPRNYLSKLLNYPKVYDNVNSISHRADFAEACLRLWELRAPFGTYNVTNPGFITTRQVVAMIEARLKPRRPFEFWASDEECYRVAARTPRSNCVLDATKLVSAGVAIRRVEDALEDALSRWSAAPDRA
jgi:dTDP-4-dehydrorhamnose reductase